MLTRDYGDLIAGLLLVACGVAFAGHAAAHYQLGTLKQMGPGMFPVALGVVLALFGGLLAVKALMRPGQALAIEVKVPLLVLAAIAAFALTIETFGMLPAVAVATLVSASADPKATMRASLFLAAALCAIAWVVFDLGLRLAIPLLRWPF